MILRKVSLGVLLVMVVATPTALAGTVVDAGHLPVVDAGHNVALLQWAWELLSSPTALTTGSKLTIGNSSGHVWTGVGFQILQMPAGWSSNSTQGTIEFEVTGATGDLGIFQVQATEIGLPAGLTSVKDDTGAYTLTSEGPPKQNQADPLLHVPQAIPEASTLALWGLGLLAGGLLWKRQK